MRNVSVYIGNSGHDVFANSLAYADLSMEAGERVLLDVSMGEVQLMGRYVIIYAGYSQQAELSLASVSVYPTSERGRVCL